eukprot:CAMPEP_0197719314 /NCGR_PEP_ID=MMETSP1434-20131217/3123_1 /TAXON_ID=265543 /ORGANISM="Minutocellus polymorphus, Strain CCMP3303" /LENGTH=311 /DNA_ID=CAMNT_0043304055 /DNA_START=65 /DNA_END=1000 /DNA_ORIENTATION=+
MTRLAAVVALVSPAATTAFVVQPRSAHAPNRIFPCPSPTTQRTVRPLRMVGAGIDPTSGSSDASSAPLSKDLNNPSTRFGEPLSDEVKEFNRGAVGFLKRAIFDTLFAGRDYPRFYALETIARVPYFSYTAALHFYETIGMWRKAKYLKIHFAEDWNEMHHLMIMESLGGAERWSDRFIAQHIAVGYYLLALGLYFWNPTMAYNLNEYVEEHAFLTYDQFVKDHGEELKAQPAPQVAVDYYRDGDLYMFDEFQTGSCEIRRPKMDNLYDVFAAIRDDEAQHVKTMAALQTETELSTAHDDSCEIPEELLGY